MTSEPQPFLRDLSGGGFSEVASRHDIAEASAIAAREEMARDQALYGAPRRPRTELPPIKAASLPQDYADRLARLDEKISREGVLIDADRFVSLGRERFQELLALDRKARTWQRITDLTRFEAVQRSLDAFEAPEIARRTTAEQVAQSGKERDEVRKITGFDDLWKATGERRETLDDIYAFHDLFNCLCFGHSMLEALSLGGRAHSPLFRGGSGEKVDLFRQWLTALQGKHVTVVLVQPLWSIVAWLANEKTAFVSPTDLARDFFNVRAPSEAQLKLAQAVLDGFLLDHRDWQLWQYVGRVTRTSQTVERLSGWRAQLAKRFPAISAFYTALRSAHHRNVGFGPEAHRELDAARWRGFVDGTIERLSRQAPELLALGLESTHPGSVIARFQGAVLVEGKHKLKDKQIQIGLPLAKAFPAATFPLEFEEVHS
jgi:hypothetical protein